MAVCLLSTGSYAQWIVEGTGTGVNSAKVSTLDASGNIYVAGNYLLSDIIFAPDTLSNTGVYDGFLVKYDSSGAFIWSASYETNGNYVQPYAIDIDGNGDVVLAGLFRDEITFESTTLNTGITGEFSNFTAKYDASGNLQWATQSTIFNTDSYIVTYGMDTDSSGNVYSGGLLRDSIQMGNDTLYSSSKGIFFSKHDVNGNYVRALVNDSVFSQVSALTFDQSGNYIYATGTYQGDLSLGLDTLIGLPATTQTFVTKLDTSLTPIWLIGFEADSVITINHKDSLLVITGRSENTATIGTDVFTGTPGETFDYVTVLDTSGSIRWSKQIITNSTTANINRNEAAFDNVGNLYVTGSFGQAGVGGINITVDSETKTSVEDYDAYVLKLDSMGNVVWLQTLGDSAQDISETISVIDSSNIYIAGQYSDSLYVTNITETNDDGGRDAFIVEIDICPEVQSRFTVNGSTTLCEGESVELIAETGTNYQYQWQKDSIDITGATASTYFASDSAEYRLIITDPVEGCTKTSYPEFITVNPLPDVEISLTDTLICDDEFSTISVYYSPNYQYEWYEDGVFIQDSLSNYTTMTSGDYYVIMTNSYDCTDSTDTVSVTVMSYPDANITPGGATTFCDGDSVELVANTGSGWNYQWYRDGAALTGDTSSSIYALTQGEYTILVSNEAECDSISDLVDVVTVTAPSAQIDSSGNLTLCDGETVNLISSTALGQSYQWQLNSTDLPNDTLSTLEVATAGDYNVVITNSNNCSTTSNILSVTVNPNPSASITPSGSLTICNGDSVQLNATVGAGLSYVWQLNGSAISGENSSSLYAKNTGFYSTLITNSFDCTDLSETETVTVNGNPTATITAEGATDLCIGDSVELTANQGSGLSYQWKEDGVDITGATFDSLVVNTSATYSVEVTNSSNCSSTSNDITINIISDPVATITPDGSTTFCDGDSVTLNGNTGSGFTYTWFRNGFTMSNTDSSITVKTSGTYEVEVTVNNSCSTLSGSVSTTVLSNEQPTIIQNGVTVSTENYTSYQWFLDGVAISGATDQLHLAVESGDYHVETVNSLGCPNASETITVCVPHPEISANGTYITSTAGSSYEWYLDDIAVPNSNQQSLLAQTSGTYKVLVTDNEGCTSFSETLVVCVPAPTITQVDDDVLQASIGTNYQWFLDGDTIHGATNMVHQVDYTGSYTVGVTNDGCTSISEPIGVVLALDSEFSDQFKVFPNPVESTLKIEMLHFTSGELFIELINVSGLRLNLEILQIEQTYEINLGHIPNGIYLLEISTDQGKYQKVISKI